MVDDPVKARWLDVQRPCPYLPEQTALMEYAYVDRMTASEYSKWLDGYWRKMGAVLFRPKCVSCRACQPVRVLTNEFRPRRVHKRVLQMNSALRVEVSMARVTQAHVDLMNRYEISREETVGWPAGKGDATPILRSLTESPLPMQQLCVYDGERLVAFCIIDRLPDGFSAVNSFWDPEYIKRSLGVFVILALIAEAQSLGLPHIYLGYFVAGCRSMEYKGRFYPSEVLTDDGWVPFRS